MNELATRGPNEEVIRLWYAPGRVHANAGGQGWPAVRLGVTALCITGSLVLLPAPLFGTDWVAQVRGPLVALPIVFPVAVGLLAGEAPLLYNRMRTLAAQRGLRRALEAEGEDPIRPTLDGLGLYCDDQLVLLRSEYKALHAWKTRPAQGPDNGANLRFRAGGPFRERAAERAPWIGAGGLRGLWESRLQLEDGETPPALKTGGGLAYRVFPREMPVPAELAARAAYLGISRDLLFRRYGFATLRRLESMYDWEDSIDAPSATWGEYERITDATPRRARRRRP